MLAGLLFFWGGGLEGARQSVFPKIQSLVIILGCVSRLERAHFELLTAAKPFYN